MNINTGRIYAALMSVFKKIEHFFTHLSEISIFAIWTSLIIIIASLIWGLSANLRGEITIRTVNKFLAGIGETRNIEQAISTWDIPGRVTQIGTWYRMASEEDAVIFPLITGGIFSPCLAIINDEGRLSTLVPLTVNGDRIMSRMNPGYLRIWIERIEENAAILKQTRDRRG
ncbi:MAG: hypothetical protein LBC27_03990 [Spirochaetaceae bacterium]|jgi:hypothetical protein|nr:hypothetical protein [Spirochaetaceae bacterium]